MNSFHQFCNICSFFGTGLKIAIKSQRLNKLVNPTLTHPLSSAINSCYHEHPLHYLCIPSDALGSSESAVPMGDTSKRIGLAMAIEEDQCYSYFSEMQLVDESIAWLPG